MTARPSYRHVQLYTMLWVVLLLCGGVTALVTALLGQVPALPTAALVALPLAMLPVLGRLIIEPERLAAYIDARRSGRV